MKSGGSKNSCQTQPGSLWALIQKEFSQWLHRLFGTTQPWKKQRLCLSSIITSFMVKNKAYIISLIIFLYSLYLHLASTPQNNIDWIFSVTKNITHNHFVPDQASHLWKSKFFYKAMSHNLIYIRKNDCLWIATGKTTFLCKPRKEWKND